MARVHSAARGGVAQVALDADQASIGPMIAITLDEKASSTNRWLIEVDAKLREGRIRVGRTLTIGPAWPGGAGGLMAQPPGTNAARLVAVACCPGAREWSLTLTAFDFTGTKRVKADADVLIGKAEDKISIGFTQGVFPVNPWGTGREAARIRTAQIVVGAGIVVWAPEEPFRIRATIQNIDYANPGNLVFVGDGDINFPGVVTPANGFPLRPGDRFAIDHNRIMGVISAGANIPVATLIEEG